MHYKACVIYKLLVAVCILRPHLKNNKIYHMVLHVHLCDSLYSLIHVFFVFSAANSAVILLNFQFANIVFLGLFSFFVLTDLHPLGENGAPSIVEIFTWIYTITSVIEEARQVRFFF